MRDRDTFGKISVIALAMLMTATLAAGCGKSEPAAAGSVEPIPAAEADSVSEPAATAQETTSGTERQDGERFEDVIIIEGMEEPVHYEHIRNDTIGIGMDYDYEMFVRRSDSDRERFISVYEDPADPYNWMEITRREEDADTAAASVRAALSAEYDLIEETRVLDHAGSCLRIEASEVKGTGHMAEELQIVYIIPAPDGCIMAEEHLSIESSEGFGRRFGYMLNTLTVNDSGNPGGEADLR